MTAFDIVTMCIALSALSLAGALWVRTLWLEKRARDEKVRLDASIQKAVERGARAAMRFDDAFAVAAPKA